jgi:sugar phosphate isomerase/epimerase
VKIGISIYSYGADLISRKMTVRDAIEHAAEVGCEGIVLEADHHLPNWPNTSVADIIAIRKFVESLGMEVACFGAYLLDMLRTDRRQTQAELVKEATKDIILANMLGARICRPFYSADTKEDLRAVISDCVPVLEEYNVIWAIEVHSPFPPSYYNDVVQTINSPYVRLLPDFSCWQTMGLPSEFSALDISTFVEILPYTACCHGKAHVFNEDGEEPGTPYKALLQALKEHKYEGYVAAEYEGWVMRYADSRMTAKTHVDLIRRYGR